MMLPTHALAAMVLALPVAALAPDVGGVALGAGFLGGVLPDLDMYVGHRKTLHFPVYYSAGAAVAGLAALLAPSPVTVALAFVLLGAAVHSVSDAFGGGLELRPWEGTSDRAVYDHYRGRWIAPRRWVRYDGAPEDLALTVGLALPLAVTVDGPLEWLVIGAVLVAAAYTAVRRALPTLAERLTAAVPSGLLARLPIRYRDAE